MKRFAVFALASSLIAVSTAQAKPPPQAQNDKSTLETALHSMAPSQPSNKGQAMKMVDHDQGDDHASARAIQVVCTKNTPAAQRSAICPTPVSPD